MDVSTGGFSIGPWGWLIDLNLMVTTTTSISDVFGHVTPVRMTRYGVVCGVASTMHSLAADDVVVSYLVTQRYEDVKAAS